MRSSLATRGQRELSRCLRELGGGGGNELPPPTHKGLSLLTTVSRRALCLLRTSSPGSRRAGRELLSYSGQTGRRGLTWEAQCRAGHSGRDRLTRISWRLLRALHRGASAGLDTQRTRLNPTLVILATQLCAPAPKTCWEQQPPPSTSRQRGSCIPDWALPPASLQPSVPLFTFTPTHWQHEPPEGREFIPLPGELSNNANGTHKAFTVQLVQEEISATQALSAWARKYSKKERPETEPNRTQGMRCSVLEVATSQANTQHVARWSAGGWPGRNNWPLSSYS